MNKLLLLLAVVGMISFAACGGSATEEATEEEEMEEAASEMMSELTTSMESAMETLDAKIAELKEAGDEASVAAAEQLAGYQASLEELAKMAGDESAEVRETAKMKFEAIKAEMEKMMNQDEE